MTALRHLIKSVVCVWDVGDAIQSSVGQSLAIITEMKVVTLHFLPQQRTRWHFHLALPVLKCTTSYTAGRVIDSTFEIQKGQFVNQGGDRLIVQESY